jgi:hypothetical protein
MPKEPKEERKRRFVAVVGLDNETKSFAAGAVVTEDDFPIGVLEHWLKGGVVKDG